VVQPLLLLLGMKASLVFASLVTMTAAAHAEPVRYVQTDVMLGGSAPVVGPNLLGSVSAGHLLTPGLWAHGELAGGLAADDQGGGSNVQAHAGVETRGCTAGRAVCAMVGLDAGVLRGSWMSHESQGMREDVTAGVIVPRFGIDAGGQRVRARLGLEIDEAFAGKRTSSYDTSSSSPAGTVGAELSAGVAYQW